jgi:hypothetical protein
MAHYMLISSRDPLDTTDVGHYYQLAEDLAVGGNRVTLFLVENGVFPARESTWSQRLTALSECGVSVLADAFSLRERGILSLCEGVHVAELDHVVDALADGAKTLWN